MKSKVDEALKQEPSYDSVASVLGSEHALDAEEKVAVRGV